MRALLFALVTLWTSTVVAATYEETFTPKAGRAYNEDINVWVYTSEFAKRFGMPEKWIDDDLKGAYAVAFRVVQTPFRTCFLSGKPEACMRNRECILDTYLSASTKIPWVDDRIADHQHRNDSARYLLGQSKKDRDWRQRPIGLPHWGGVVKFGVGEQHLGGFPVREYDKNVYPGIMFISFSKSCVTPPGRASWIEFYDYRPRHSDAPLWQIRTTERTHRIEMPTSFMRRLYESWMRRSRMPDRGDWAEVLGADKQGEKR